MSKINKILANKKIRKHKIRKNKNPMLEKCPQRRGNCVKVFLASPRKPNSAARRVAKIVFNTSPPTYTVAYCPGIGHSLQKHSSVLIRGGRTKDLPGMKYKMIRGKLDLRDTVGRMNGRSKYGTFKRLTNVITGQRKAKYLKLENENA